MAVFRIAALCITLFLAAGCATPPPPAGAAPVAEGIRTVQPGVYSAGYLRPQDVPALEAAGIRQVIDLTTPGEARDFDEATAVRSAGMRYVRLPVAGAEDLTRANVQAFDRLFADAARPVLVHCASGNRVGAMVALRAAWIDGASTDQALAEGRRWGLASLGDAVRTRLEDER